MDDVIIILFLEQGESHKYNVLFKGICPRGIPCYIILPVHSISYIK